MDEPGGPLPADYIGEISTTKQPKFGDLSLHTHKQNLLPFLVLSLYAKPQPSECLHGSYIKLLNDCTDDVFCDHYIQDEREATTSRDFLNFLHALYHTWVSGPAWWNSSVNRGASHCGLLVHFRDVTLYSGSDNTS